MIPTRAGQLAHSGFFAGYNRIHNKIYAVFAAPKHTEAKLEWDFDQLENTPCLSIIDGCTNTVLLSKMKNPVALHCSSLTANNCSDWYLPSAAELELCNRHLAAMYGRSNEFFTQVLFAPSLIPQVKKWGLGNLEPSILLDFRYNYPHSFRHGYYWNSSADAEYGVSCQSFWIHGRIISCTINEGAQNIRPVRRELIANKENK